MKSKKHIFTTLISILVSVFLITTAVYAVTTVGNDVLVGGGLIVSGNRTIKIDDIDHTVTAYFDGAGAESEFGVMSSAWGVGIRGAGTRAGIIGLGTGYARPEGSITTYGICGYVAIGGEGEDEDYAGCLGFYNATSTTHYGLSIENNSTTTITDIILQNGETISNATSGTIKFTGDEATTTISVGAASSTACIRLRTADDTGWTYYASATPEADLTTTTAAACGY